jgi:uridine monophosphate synthetase
METFFSFLEKRVLDCSSLLCVGLDPHLADLPEPTLEGARRSCLRLIEQTARYAAAFKVNAAFFEALGPAGWALLREVVVAVQAQSDRLGSRIPVILDAKRGDIASTAEAYASSAFKTLGVDAITLSPYLGQDAIEPFIVNREKGAFILCRTSNPGSAAIQELPLAIEAPTITREPLRLYEHIAGLASSWNTRGNVGLVVGATQPEALARVRAMAPKLWILAPGVGAQGADLQQALAAGLRSDGMGMLIAVSRSLARAADPSRAAAELRDELANIQHESSPTRPASSRLPRAPSASLALADDLLASGCVQLGKFTLKSGKTSPIYFDLRRLASHPRLLARAAEAYLPLLRRLRFARLAGLPYAALPIATAIALQGDWPMVYPRREAKDYGTRAAIEGEHHAGEQVVIIDDVATTGGAKIEALEKLRAAGLVVTDAVVLIDREAGAHDTLRERGVELHAVMRLRDLVAHWQARGAVTEHQARDILSALP